MSTTINIGQTTVDCVVFNAVGNSQVYFKGDVQNDDGYEVPHATAKVFLAALGKPVQISVELP